MVNSNSNSAFLKLTPGLMIFAGLVLTVMLILGIKYFISDEEPSPVAPAAVKEDKLFKDEAGKGPGFNPAYRSETSTGDSLEIFAKTNTGYAKEESSSPARGEAGTAGDTEAKSLKTARNAPVKRTGATATVIPRMQAPKAFGSSSGSQTPPSGIVIPDISALMKQSQKKTGQ